MNEAARSASETALGVSRLRAIHQLRDGDPKILDDPVAPRLMEAADFDRIKAYDLANESALTRGLRAHVVMRSRFAEDQLRDSVGRGTSQYIVLGAGFDTFAYRQPAWARDLRVFEVDHAASQAAKRRLLTQQHVAIPPNVRFASADFDQPGAIAQALHAQGFDPSARAFVSCLGVLVYLTPTALDGVFAFMRSLALGSECVFTISAPVSELDADGRAAREALEKAAASVGEPWRTHLTFADVQSRLAVFQDVVQPTADAIANRYFQGRTDGLRAPRRPTVVVAVR